MHSFVLLVVDFVFVAAYHSIAYHRTKHDDVYGDTTSNAGKCLYIYIDECGPHPIPLPLIAVQCSAVRRNNFLFLDDDDVVDVAAGDGARYEIVVVRFSRRIN